MPITDRNERNPVHAGLMNPSSENRQGLRILFATDEEETSERLLKFEVICPETN